MSNMSKEFRADLTLQLASMLFEQLPFWKRWSVAKWYKSNNDDTRNIWRGCLIQAARMIDMADYVLPEQLEDDHDH